VNEYTHCTPENTHWTPGIIASNGCAGATPAHPAHTSGARASGAYPAERLQPHRGFHALREGFSPHPLPLQASGRPDTPFSLPKEVVCQTSPLSFRHQDAQTPPSPRVAEGGRGDEGANTHGNARASLPERCARLRRVPPQRRSSPAGASTRSGRASARTLSRFRHQDAQTPPSPRVGEGGRGDEGANAHGNARAPGANEVRAPPAHTPAETLQPRRGFHALREGFSPHPLSFQLIRTPKRSLLPVWQKGVGGMRGQTRTGMPAHPGANEVRAPPAHTPAETLQPRRGFHALREGFSPHPLPFQASGRPDTPFSPCGRRGSGG
jgi:hypothetical protein